MSQQFSSKEIHFLKTDSDELSIQPPDNYFCDLILSKTVQLKTFETRLENIEIPGDNFLCAVIQVSSDRSEEINNKIENTFEATFNSFLDHQRGIWESLGTNSFVLAFWDYDNEKKASSILISLKEKLSASLKADILIGVAKYPFHDFSKADTIENALKATDHAAFFGPDTLIHFDGTSLNICGDRFYQLNQGELSVQEYIKGLEIKPKDINLINSLGVCHAVAGNLEKARDEFEKAAKLNPKEEMVIYNIGLLHHIDDDKDKAIMYLKKAHAINNNVFEIELLLGQILHSTDKPDQAMPHLKKAGDLNPESGHAFRMKGEIYLDDKKPEKAAPEFNKAIKLNPSDAVSLSGYAKCLELQDKNLKIALSFAKNSLAIEPDNQLFKQRLTQIEKKIDSQNSCKNTIKSA